MSQSLPKEFPGQDIEKSLINIQDLLDTAKPLTEKLVVDKKIRQEIIKYLEELQVLLSINQSQYRKWENLVRAEYKQYLDKNNPQRQNDIKLLIYKLYEDGHITWDELIKIRAKKF